MLYKLSWLCSILLNDADDAISLDDVEADEDIKVEEVNVKSTKRPTKQGGKGPTKKAKVEAMENNLLQRAIDTMSKSEKSTADSFDKFADYVASELRAITSKQLQGWAKLQIQTTGLLVDLTLTSSTLISSSASTSSRLIASSASFCKIKHNHDNL